jgi:hypothetical protein
LYCLGPATHPGFFCEANPIPRRLTNEMTTEALIKLGNYNQMNAITPQISTIGSARPIFCFTARTGDPRTKRHKDAHRIAARSNLAPDRRVRYIHSMSKRLQVLLRDDEMSAIRRMAKSEASTVGEWVRRVLREARTSRPVVVDPETKLNAVRRGAKYAFPPPIPSR